MRKIFTICLCWALFILTSNLQAQCVSGDCENGSGTFVFDNGDKYVGQWKAGGRHGRGVYTWGMRGEFAGDSYSGEFYENTRSGYGTYISANGSSYVGQWKLGKKHGKGTYTSSNGSTYTGDYVEDNREGYGIYIWGESTEWAGDKYEGEWVENKRTGKGKYLYADGTVEEGIFSENKFISAASNAQVGCISGNCVDGFGTTIFENGDKYVGQWRGSMRHGKGVYTWSSNGQSAGDSYDGNFVDNFREGYGIYYFADGSKYVGNWKQGMEHGKGTMTLSNGSSYTGDYVNDEKHGYGVYIWGGETDWAGDKYEGQWEHGSRTGTGTYTYASGTINKGIFKDNVYIGSATTALASVTWQSPVGYTTSSNANTYSIKACIKSDSKVQTAQVYVNGQLQQNTRGFEVVSSDACTNTIERTIALVEGKNEVKIVIINDAGEATSEVRAITYSPTSATNTQTEKRYALIIGNAAYDDSPLKNPTNDAKSIAAALKAKGFEVVLCTDVNQTDMKKAIRTFGEQLHNNGGIGLFYYAGHGMQVGVNNYLIPVGANIMKEQDVEFEAVDLGRILSEMEYARNGLNIVILDACRDNPFKSTRGGDKGLATTSAPIGTFIAYATSPGSVAADGDGTNGLYTQELLKAINEPNAPIETVFKKVRISVLQKSNNLQTPWENSSITGDFYFSK